MADFRAQLLAAFEIEHRDHLEAIRRALEDPAVADLREMFRRAHSLKGAARAVDMPAVEAVAHELEDLLSARTTAGALDAASTAAIRRGLDRIESLVAQGDAEPAPVAAPADAEPLADPEPEASAPRAELVRVDAEAVNRLTRAARRLSGDVQAQAAALEPLRRLAREVRRLRGAPGRDAETEAALDAVANSLAGLWRRGQQAQWAAAQGLEALRAGIEQLALTPAENVLGDLGRMVRDLARERDVEVEVRLDGLSTQAERRILQAMRDPVIHLLRNALRHGWEGAAARKAAGKPDALRVGLELDARGGRLRLTVWDDGGGPDRRSIEAAAIAAGLLEPTRSDGAPPTDEEIFALAFAPGVSSAGEVDRLAGRGMGLSVVGETARALGGSARLSRRAPHGAAVTLIVPQSTARQSLTVVEAGGARYALPTLGLKRLLRLGVSTLQTVEGAPTVRIEFDGRDVLTPVHALASLIGPAFADVPVAEGAVHAVLLARGERHLAIAVDALSDIGDRVVEPLAGGGVDPALVLGAALLDDEVPVAVLDPDALIDRWLRDERRLAAAGLGLAARKAEGPARTRTVLVVDDSITTRTLEKSILESQGYKVLLAVDGLEALTLLRSGQALVDLVVADIEMPRMDGLSLLQAIKADASLEALPVVLMTSRDDPEDVRRGMDLGAEAYITKQSFDQRELLSVIGRVL